MHFREILEAADLFRQDPTAHFYDQYMQEKKWQEWEDPERLSREEVARLFSFIKTWDRFFQAGEEEITKFLQVYKEIFPLLKTLRRRRIDNIDFGARISYAGRLLTAREAISTIFDKIAYCFRRYESTDTSKIIHTVNPELFVMWDYKISHNLLGLSNSKTASATDYTDRFLSLMQKTARGVVRNYVAEHKCDWEEAVRRISESGGNKTLAALLDQYNWIYKDNRKSVV